MKLKTQITIAANITTISAILAGLIALALLGLSLSYHPRPKLESYGLLAAVVTATALPIVIIWSVKFQIIRRQWLRNIFLFFLFSYGGFLVLSMGKEVITDSGDFIIWFPLCLHGVLIFISAFLLAKLKPSS